MARATYAGKDLIAAVRQCLPVFSTEDGRKLLESIKEHAKATDDAGVHEFWAALELAAQKYRETPLTDDDLVKIKAHDAEIAKKQGEINKKASEITTELSEKIADAAKNGETASVIELTLKMQQDIAKATAKQRGVIQREEKLKAAVKSKQLDAGTTAFSQKLEVHDGSDTGTTSSGKHPFEGCQFKVKATRTGRIDQEPLSYAVDWYVDVDTRRIWVVPVGDGYTPQFRLEAMQKPVFAGFWMQKTGKSAITTKSRLDNANYVYINICTREKPKSQEDFLECTRMLNQRIELDNMDSKYSGGAAYALRIVEEYDSQAKDAGSQVLRADCPEIDWDALDAHKALVESLIDAELNGSGEEPSEDAENAENSEETVNPAEKAA